MLTHGRRLRVQVISRSGLKTLARSVGRHNHSSIARQVMKNAKSRGFVLQELLKMIQKEMRTLSKVRTGKCVCYSSV